MNDARTSPAPQARYAVPAIARQPLERTHLLPLGSRDIADVHDAEVPPPGPAQPSPDALYVARPGEAVDLARAAQAAARQSRVGDAAGRMPGHGGARPRGPGRRPRLRRALADAERTFGRATRDETRPGWPISRGLPGRPDGALLP